MFPQKSQIVVRWWIILPLKYIVQGFEQLFQLGVAPETSVTPFEFYVEWKPYCRPAVVAGPFVQENPVMRLSSPGVLVAQSLEFPILSCHSICSVHDVRGHGLHQRETPVPVSVSEVKPCGTGLITVWVAFWVFSHAVLLAGSEAGVVVINHASHLYCKCCMWAEFFSWSQPDFQGFRRVLRFPPSSKSTHSVLASCGVSRAPGLSNMKYKRVSKHPSFT